MLYADYNFYQAEYSGNLTEEQFNKVIKKATRLINDKTYDRAITAFNSDMKEKISLCCCEICDILHHYESYKENTSNGAVVSDNNDGYSVTFVNADMVKMYFKTNINEVCTKYLTRPKNLMLGWI